MSDVQEFTANVHEESGSFWAEVAELPGCFATGDNLNELREALEEAVSLYLLDEPGLSKIGSMRVRIAA